MAHFRQRLRGDFPKASIRGSHHPPFAGIGPALVLFPVKVLQGKLAVMAGKYKSQPDLKRGQIYFSAICPAPAGKGCGTMPISKSDTLFRHDKLISGS
jgi:hypothetical protein